MASVVGEAVLGKVCEMVLEITLRKLAKEANMVLHFRKEMRWLNKKLRHVKGFLKDADQQSRHNEDVNEWLEKIRVICLLAEDICEESAVESLSGNKILSLLRCNKWIYRYRMGRRINDIKYRIRSIIEEGNELKLLHDVSSVNEAFPSTSQRVEWRRSCVLPSDSHPVGIESKVEDVLRLLNNDASPVIAVVGMGGAGKTFLLQHVYSSVKSRYEKCIWVSVSQSYSLSKLQCDIASHLGLDEQVSRVSEQRAAEIISENLGGKRCLVVLDDVWRAGREEDLLSKLGLPTGHNCPCKIVVTTRNREVCRNLHAQMYEMQCLSDGDSWSLFCVYAFEGSRGINRDLEVLGRKIVKQCGNLPLAIKTVAASLANSRMPRDWEAKLEQLEGVHTANIDPVIPILRLSYDALPSHLKACFAYLSFFPEDQVIECEYLINLWIGEGFIPAGEGQWDAAWDCLYQLPNLCLLQLWEEIGFTSVGSMRIENLTKYCRIHDLLLDLAIRVSTENGCVFSIEEAAKDGGADWCRILVAKKHIRDADVSRVRPVCLRTFSLSQNEGITRIPADLFTAMRGLRVLDLSDTRISALPESIQKMKLLKVLNLRETRIEEVPECVRHLKSLLFLALPLDCCELPVWINELKCLQHLECVGVGRMPKGLSELISLRTLRSDWLNLSSEEDEFVRSEDFVKMTQLQELRLNVGREMELEGTLAPLVKMRHLFIRNKTSTTQLELSENLKAMNHLETLFLSRFAVPSWICDFANLRELQLSASNCSYYPALQRMSTLVRLNFAWNFRCRELPETFGKAGGFPQLRFFKIYEFGELEEFPELEEGAMACLEEFSLTACPKLKKVGNGLELLKRLKLFKCSGSVGLHETFKVGGEYWRKIKSINPHVTIKC